VVDVTHNSLVVKAGSGSIGILELQVAGKKRISVEEFLRGQRVEPGTVLGG
jgi:methionyl-tRNA formyltransferase